MNSEKAAWPRCRLQRLVRVVALSFKAEFLVLFQERDGWYQVFVRGESRAIGWVRKEQVTTTNDPPPAPPPATDS